MYALPCNCSHFPHAVLLKWKLVMCKCLRVPDRSEAAAAPSTDLYTRTTVPVHVHLCLCMSTCGCACACPLCLCMSPLPVYVHGLHFQQLGCFHLHRVVLVFVVWLCIIGHTYFVVYMYVCVSLWRFSDFLSVLRACYLSARRV